MVNLKSVSKTLLQNKFKKKIKPKVNRSNEILKIKEETSAIENGKV